MKQNKYHQRNEQAVRDKLDRGWNCFTREEIQSVIQLLDESRKVKQALQQRIHTSHGDAVAWHYEGDVGLHARRPAPNGARNLFEKPPRIDFVRGWRIPKGCRISGFKRTEDGCLIRIPNKTPQSPNNLMRQLHRSLNQLSQAYRVYEESPCSPSEASE